MVPMERRLRPCRFRNLNSLERGVICNGCGGKGGFFRPPQYRFRASCNHHDFNYWIGGGDVERKEADDQFLAATLEDAGLAESWWRRLWLRGAAYRYYWAVRAFGGKFFNFKDASETDDQLWLRVERLMNAKGFDVEANDD